MFTHLHNTCTLRQEGIGRFYLMKTPIVQCKKGASVVNILMFCFCIYSPGFITIFSSLVKSEFFNKGSMVQGHSKIPGGECHRHENGFGNEMTTFQTFGFNS